MSRARTAARPARPVLPVEPTPAQHPSAERCGACAGSRVTRLSMTLTDGAAVDFTSCHSCEHKTWRREGQPLDLPAVLAKTQKHKV